jgi:hypothetical protein
MMLGTLTQGLSSYGRPASFRIPLRRDSTVVRCWLFGNVVRLSQREKQCLTVVLTYTGTIAASKLTRIDDFLDFG